MTYAVFLRPAGLRDLQNLPPNLRERVESAIDALAENPRPPGCKKLVGFEDEWRVRVGEYRVLYVIDDTKHRVTIARVAHRREAYR
jgi:mRNA interferase RelE/StbE